MLIQRKIGLFFAVIITFSIFSGGMFYKNNRIIEVDKSEISIDRQSGFRVYKNKPFTGLSMSHHKTGELAKEEQFLDGKRHGFIKHWFKNGLLGFKSTYQYGRRNGTTTSWWNNGKMRSQTEYLDDKTEGLSWRWYSSGQKFKKLSFASGQPVGIQQGWRTNGKLFINFEYRNGRTYGLKKSNMCVDLNDEKIVFNTTK